MKCNQKVILNIKKDEKLCVINLFAYIFVTIHLRLISLRSVYEKPTSETLGY